MDFECSEQREEMLMNNTLYECAMASIGESIIEHLLDEIRMREQEIDVSEDGMDDSDDGMDDTDMSDNTMRPMNGSMFGEHDSAFIKYVVLNGLIVERYKGLAEEEVMFTVGHAQLLRELLQRALAMHHGENDEDSESMDRIKSTIMDSLMEANGPDSVTAVLSSMLTLMRAQENSEAAGHVLYYIMDALMSIDNRELRHGAISHVVDFLAKNSNEEQKAEHFGALIYIVLLRTDDASRDTIQLITHLFLMADSQEEREAAMTFLAHVIMSFPVAAQREMALQAQLFTLQHYHAAQVMNSMEDDEDSEAIMELARQVAEASGRERVQLINQKMREAQEAADDGRNDDSAVIFRRINLAVLWLEDDDERNDGINVILQYLDENVEDPDGEVFMYMIEIILSTPRREPALMHVINLILTLNDTMERDQAIAVIVNVAHNFDDKYVRSEGLRIVSNVVFWGFGLEDDYMALAHALASNNNESRRAVINALLHYAYAWIPVDGEAAGGAFDLLLEGIMAQDSEHRRMEDIYQVIEFLYHIPDVEIQGLVYSHMISFALRRNDMQRTEMLTLLVHSISYVESRAARDETFGFVLKVISMHPDTYQREAGLRAAMAALRVREAGSGNGGGGGRGDSGSSEEDDDVSEEYEALFRAIGMDERTRRTVIRDVIDHARYVMHEDHERAQYIFAMVLKTIEEQESVDVRRSGWGAVMEYIASIEDNDELLVEIFTYFVKYQLKEDNPQKLRESLTFIINAVQLAPNPDRSMTLTYIGYLLADPEMSEQKQALVWRIYFDAVSDEGRDAAPSPRWPLRSSPSIRAGPARVMMAISFSVYSRVMSASVQRSRTDSGTSFNMSARRDRSISRAIISGYARNDPPFGWSVLMATCHGSLTNRYHSSPIAH